jgi:hypothetical protein
MPTNAKVDDVFTRRPMAIPFAIVQLDNILFPTAQKTIAYHSSLKVYKQQINRLINSPEILRTKQVPVQMSRW